MRKPKYPHGVTRRGMSIVVSFALIGKTKYKTLGPASVVSIEDAERER
jgi:hypothetical protein